jgi:hypothetical protein
MTTVSWQREDGFPSDDYFEAVATALTAAGISVASWWRDEDWDVAYELAPEAYQDGPLKWAKHGLYVSWQCGEEDKPAGPGGFTGLGWYWVPYTKPDTALGALAQEFRLPYLADPDRVAAAVAALVQPATDTTEKD